MPLFRVLGFFPGHRQHMPVYLLIPYNLPHDATTYCASSRGSTRWRGPRWSTSRWPPCAALAHVHAFQGHPLACIRRSIWSHPLAAAFAAHFSFNSIHGRHGRRRRTARHRRQTNWHAICERGSTWCINVWSTSSPHSSVNRLICPSCVGPKGGGGGGEKKPVSKTNAESAVGQFTFFLIE